MTTIATDGKTIACDTQVSSGNSGSKWPARVNKIHRVGDRYVGISGDLWQAHLFIKYLKDGKVPEKKLKDISVLIVEKDGSIYHTDYTFNELQLTSPFAVGSGGDYAIGALGVGASPVEAIKVAAKYDAYTNNDVLVYYVKDLKKKPKKDPDD